MHTQPFGPEGIRLRGEESWRHVFEASPSAMVLVASDGRIGQINQQAEALFGWTREELLGQPIEVLLPGRFRAQHPADRARYFAQPVVRAMGAGRDLFGLRKDGTEVPVEIGLNPMRTVEGEFVLAAIIDITQRKNSEALLRASLVEKETLLREIHHRVKNNMQVVSSLLSLQTSCVDEPRYRQMFETCQARVRAMALIHEKLYGAANLTTIDFGAYVHDLVRMLAASYGQDGSVVRLAIETEPIALDIRIAIPLGLILNEMVTNAFKHAFVGGRAGVLRVRFARTGEQCRLIVADDGVGLGPNFDSQHDRTLGMRMVRALIQQIDGELAVAAPPGTQFTITFVA